MSYHSKSILFRSLDDLEEEQFRAHARQIDPPHGATWITLHPVCREEWTKRGIVEDTETGSWIRSI